MKISRWALLACTVLCGCGASGSISPDLAPACVGAAGNSLGVGKSCADSMACPSTAPFCTPVIGTPTKFCTRFCDAGAECGESAPCGCAGGACVCDPKLCR